MEYAYVTNMTKDYYVWTLNMLCRNGIKANWNIHSQFKCQSSWKPYQMWTIYTKKNNWAPMEGCSDACQNALVEVAFFTNEYLVYFFQWWNLYVFEKSPHFLCYDHSYNLKWQKLILIAVFFLPDENVSRITWTWTIE